MTQWFTLRPIYSDGVAHAANFAVGDQGRVGQIVGWCGYGVVGAMLIDKPADRHCCKTCLERTQPPEEVMGQGSPDTWHYTDTGIRSASGDLVCDDPDPTGCPHLTCNVAKPKILLNDWRGTDSETTTRQKRRALAMLEENVRVLKSMPLQELDLDGLRIAVRKTTP